MRGQLRNANSPENLSALALYAKIQKSGFQNDWSFACYVSQVEPRTYKVPLLDDAWVEAMQEELLQFQKLGVWTLTDLPPGWKKIGTKWVFKCKKMTEE